MPKDIRIVIYVEGGIAYDVLSEQPGIKAMIVDYDDRAEVPEDRRLVRDFFDVEVNPEYINKTIQGKERN